MVKISWHIIGSGGYIAGRLLARIPANHPVIRYAHHADAQNRAIELTCLKAEDLEEIQAGDYVVFLAAISSPDVCNNHYETAYAINVTGTAACIDECLRRGAKVLFFSSDVVMGGIGKPCDETVPAVPFGNYGKMKYEIEQKFCSNPNFKVFRLSFVYSKDDKFFRYLQKCLLEDAEAEVFEALYRNVIYVEDVVSAILALADTFDRWETSVFHLSGTELCSRADLAKIYQQIHPELRYHTCVPAASFFEARPNIIETRSVYLEKLLGRPATLVRDALLQELL